MFDAQGNVRGPYKGIFAELSPADAEDLEARSDALGRAFIDQGITFSLSGQERPFPLDLVPRVISAAEWSRLEKGIKQRVKALEMYLDDIYGDQEILRDGVILRSQAQLAASFDADWSPEALSALETLVRGLQSGAGGQVDMLSRFVTSLNNTRP